MISSPQAFLWKDDPVFRYFFVLGLHLFSLGGLYIALSPGARMGKRLTFFLASWDSHKQQIARVLLGAILSVCNITFTALEMHALVR